MSIFENGWDKWLRKGDQLESPAETLSSDTSIGLVGGGSADNPINRSVNSNSIAAGEIGSLLGHGKKTFSDLTPGILFGLDTDGVYKWYIGSSTNSADWAVTTANTLTIKGTIIAASPTSNEKVVISSGSVIGYGPDGTSIIWRFLQEPSYNNVMTLYKRDFTPSYGNALSIFDYSTDVNHTFDIRTDTGASTGNTSKCLINLYAECDKLLNTLQLVTDNTDQSCLIYAEKNSGDLDKAMIHLKNSVNDGEAICIDQLGASNANTAFLLNNAGTGYSFQVYSTGVTNNTEFVEFKYTDESSPNTGRWALERVDAVTDDFCMKLGAYYFWVDSTGDFRIKSGRPANDTDGVVVGSQS